LQSRYTNNGNQECAHPDFAEIYRPGSSLHFIAFALEPIVVPSKIVTLQHVHFSAALAFTISSERRNPRLRHY
jgi:hypothetical protein